MYEAGVVGSLGSTVSISAHPLLPHRPRDQFPWIGASDNLVTGQNGRKLGGAPLSGYGLGRRGGRTEAALKPREHVIGSGPCAPSAHLGARVRVSGAASEGWGSGVGLGWVQLDTGLTPLLCLPFQDIRCAPQRPHPDHRKAAAASTFCSCQIGWPGDR